MFWNYVRSNTKVREQLGDRKISDGQIIDNPKMKADLLNEIFSSVFTKKST